MMEYIVVTSGDEDDFQELVKLRLAEGWQLQGGVSVALLTTEDRHGEVHISEWFAQAMTRDRAA